MAKIFISFLLCFSLGTGMWTAACPATDHAPHPSTATTTSLITNITPSDVRIGLENTFEDQGQLYFDLSHALESGMSPTLAYAYFEQISARQLPTSPPFRSSGTELLANEATCPGCIDIDGDDSPRYTTQEVIDCWLSQLGIGLATASMIAAITATGGIAALAYAGFGLSAIQVIRACYK